MHYVEINEFVASRLLVHADNSLRFVCTGLQIGELSYFNFAIAIRVIIQKETKKKRIRVKFQRVSPRLDEFFTQYPRLYGFSGNC